MQGIRWIMNREEPNGLVIIQQGQPNYLDKVRSCDTASFFPVRLTHFLGLHLLQPHWSIWHGLINGRIGTAATSRPVGNTHVFYTATIYEHGTGVHCLVQAIDDSVLV